MKKQMKTYMNDISDKRTLAKALSVFPSGEKMDLTYIGSGSTCIVYRAEDGNVYKEFAPLLKNDPMSEREGEELPLIRRAELTPDEIEIYERRRASFLCEGDTIKALRDKYNSLQNNMFIIPRLVNTSLGQCQRVVGFWGDSLEKIYADMSDLSDIEKFPIALARAIDLFSLISLYHSDENEGESGVVHFDIKPQNLFGINSDGRCVALRNVDFGSAADIGTLIDDIRNYGDSEKYPSVDGIAEKCFVSSRVFYNYDRINEIIASCIDRSESDERIASDIRTLDLIAAWKTFLCAFDMGAKKVLLTSSADMYCERTILMDGLDGIFDSVIANSGNDFYRWYSVYCELCRVETGIFASRLEHRMSAGEIASSLKTVKDILIGENAAMLRDPEKRRILALNSISEKRASNLIPQNMRSLHALNEYCEHLRIPYEDRIQSIINMRVRERIDLRLLADIEYGATRYSRFDGNTDSNLVRCGIPIVALYENASFPLLITSEGGQGKTTGAYVLQAELLCRGIPCYVVEGKNVRGDDIEASCGNCVNGSVFVLDSWDELTLDDFEKSSLAEFLNSLSDRGVKVIVTSKYIPTRESDKPNSPLSKLFGACGNARICEFTESQIKELVNADIGEAPRLYALLSNTMCMSIYMSLGPSDRAAFASVSNTYQFLSEYFSLTFKNKRSMVTNPQDLFASIGEQIYFDSANKATKDINLGVYPGLLGIVEQTKTDHGFHIQTSHSKYSIFFLAAYIKSKLGGELPEVIYPDKWFLLNENEYENLFEDEDSIVEIQKRRLSKLFIEVFMMVGESEDDVTLEMIRKELMHSPEYKLSHFYILLGASGGCLDDEYFCMKDRSYADYENIFSAPQIRYVYLHYNQPEYEECVNMLSNLVDAKIENNTHIKWDNGCIVSISDNSLLRGTAKSVISPYVTSIGDYAFSGCTSLTSIIIPDNITNIGIYAFYGCGSLTSVSIPENVKSIGSEAFYECKSLTSVNILYGVTNIGSGAFYGCASLTSVNIPESVVSMGGWAFSRCTALTTVKISGSIKSIESYAFYGCTSLTSVNIPESVTNIGKMAFRGCTSLTSVTIPEKVKNIGGWAFRGCTSLTGIKIPKEVTSISGYAFSRCTSLTRVTIPQNVESIGYSAFRGCTSLASITIPDSTEIIDKYAFYGCTSLTIVTIPNSVKIIGSSAFSACAVLTSISVDENNANYKSIDGNLYTKDGKTLIQYAVSKNDASFTIPDSVTCIGNSAFKDCAALTSVTIPDGVTNIGKMAFWKCISLKSVMIPGKVTNIGSSAFKDCTALTSITIPDDVKSIGKMAFWGCTSLRRVTIGNGVIEIGDGAFENCPSLKSVTIPKNVKRMEGSAFDSGTKLIFNPNKKAKISPRNPFRLLKRDGK